MDQAQTGQPQGTPAISDEELKRAFTAFKKRLKLTKLDQESKLGAHRPMTSGKKSEIQGIVPPREFAPAVWAELARRGQLKSMGGGFYSMP